MDCDYCGEEIKNEQLAEHNQYDSEVKNFCTSDCACEWEMINGKLPPH